MTLTYRPDVAYRSGYSYRGGGSPVETRDATLLLDLGLSAQVQAQEVAVDATLLLDLRLSVDTTSAYGEVNPWIRQAYLSPVRPVGSLSGVRVGSAHLSAVRQRPAAVSRTRVSEGWIPWR